MDTTFSNHELFPAMFNSYQAKTKPINQSINLSIMANFVANELLLFLSFQYDEADRDSIYSTISEFYSLEESIVAKQILINECNTLGISDAIYDFKKRRHNAKGNGNQKVVKDILDIWRIIDTQKAGKTSSTFVAVDPTRLPTIDMCDLSIRHLFSLFSHLQKQVTDIGNIVTRIDKKCDKTDILNGSFAGNYSPHCSPSHSLPWTPAPEITEPNSITRSSLKRPLNSSAMPFRPSK